MILQQHKMLPAKKTLSFLRTFVKCVKKTSTKLTVCLLGGGIHPRCASLLGGMHPCVGGASILGVGGANILGVIQGGWEEVAYTWRGGISQRQEGIPDDAPPIPLCITPSLNRIEGDSHKEEDELNSSMNF